MVKNILWLSKGNLTVNGLQEFIRLNKTQNVTISMKEIQGGIIYSTLHVHLCPGTMCNGKIATFNPQH